MSDTEVLEPPIPGSSPGFIAEIDRDRPPYIAPERMYKFMEALPEGRWGAETRVTLTEWLPTRVQRIAMYSPVEELFLGGARGGGKSDWLLADYAKQAKEWGEASQGILFRRTKPEFVELWRKAARMFRGIAKWTEKDARWTFRNGATLRMAYLDSFADVGRYQGQEYTWIGFDELTEWPDPAPYLWMFSVRRNTHGVPGRVRATGNPGRPGHVWVKQRFVDPAEPFTVYTSPDTGMQRLYVPAILEDNPHLFVNDPTYEQALFTIGDENKIQAQRYGDWNAFVGQALHEWDEDKHVIHPIHLDPTWPKWCSLDWNTLRPYAMLYFCRAPSGHVFLFRERYGIAKNRHGEEQYNVGSRENAFTVAREEYEFAQDMGISDIVIDGNQDHLGTGETVQQMFRQCGWNVIKPTKDRIAGKNAVHKWLGTILETGKPILQVFNKCRHTRRTLPALVYNSRTGPVEDVDTDGEDHIFDALKYSAMSHMAVDTEYMASASKLLQQHMGRGTAVHQDRYDDFDVNDPELIWGPDRTYMN